MNELSIEIAGTEEMEYFPGGSRDRPLLDCEKSRFVHIHTFWGYYVSEEFDFSGIEFAIPTSLKPCTFGLRRLRYPTGERLRLMMYI
jgi:hypothetical protein